MSATDPETPGSPPVGASASTLPTAWAAMRGGTVEELLERRKAWEAWGERFQHYPILKDQADQFMSVIDRLVGQVERLACPYPEPRVEVPGQTALEDHLKPAWGKWPCPGVAKCYAGRNSLPHFHWKAPDGTIWVTPHDEPPVDDYAAVNS